MLTAEGCCCCGWVGHVVMYSYAWFAFRCLPLSFFSLPPYCCWFRLGWEWHWHRYLGMCVAGGLGVLMLCI